MTSYIVIRNPKIEEIEGKNPEHAEEKYRDKHMQVKNIAIVPRNAFKLNGKRVPYKINK